MLCERCKVREANIHYTEVVNGVATEHNLCSQCAKEMDFGAYAGIAGIFDSELPIGKLLSQLLGLSGVAEANLPEEVENLLLECDVPEWYVESMKKIMYLFPKSHLVALLKRDICNFEKMNKE